jgi:type II secretory pathway component PulF
MPPRIEKLLFSFGLVGSAIAALMPFIVVPLFNEMFVEFGTALPLPTDLVVNYYQAACVLPLLVLAAWFFWPWRDMRSVAACTIGLSSLVLATLLLVLAMYLPFYKLAAHV